MADIVPVPILLSDVILQIGTDNYQQSVSKVLLEPDTPVEIYQGLTPGAIIPVVGTPVWWATIDYPQDHASAASLSEYFRTNVGQQKTVIFKPKKPNTTGPTYTIDMVILPGPIGGEVNKIARGSVKLPCVGQPAKTTA